MKAIAVPLLVAACEPRSVASVDTIRPVADAAPAVDGASALDSAPVRRSDATPPLLVGELDTSDWRTAPARAPLLVTWIVRSDLEPKKFENAIGEGRSPWDVKVPVEFHLSLAGHEHVITLQGNSAGPQIERCTDSNPLSLDYFGSGQGSKFSLVRVDAEWMAFEDSSADNDGYCGSDSGANCNGAESSIRRRFRLPKDTVVRERVIEVERSGERTVVGACPEDP